MISFPGGSQHLRKAIRECFTNRCEAIEAIADFCDKAPTLTSRISLLAAGGPGNIVPKGL
jgi:hypothetical protein